MPYAAFEDFHYPGQELRGELPIGDAVINGERKIGHRPHLNAAIDRYDTFALTPDGENGRLRWIDHGSESIWSARAEIGDADGPTLQFLLL